MTDSVTDAMSDSMSDTMTDAIADIMSGTMSDNAADTVAVENACRDIDRYIDETASPPAAQERPPISPSERLRALGRHQVGSLQPPLTMGAMETPLFPDRR
jgi:hypothetical protein